jgi:hypothetical protein
VCPRIEFGCRSRRTRPRFREARLSWQGGRVDGNPGSRCSQEHRGQQRHRQLAPWWQSHGAGVGPSRVSERASRGEGLRKMEGTPGRFSGRSFTRADRRRSWRLSRGACARASRALWERRQECQRQGVHASRREDNARHDEDPAKKFANLCRLPKRIALSCNRRSPPLRRRASA